MAYPESTHPYVADDTQTYTVPDFPVGVTTPIYIVFSLDTYSGPVGFGTSLEISTDLYDNTFDVGAQLSGNTLEVPSSTGIVTFALHHGFSSEYYGYRVLEIVLDHPRYLIGNPHPDDGVSLPGFFGDPTPKQVHTDVSGNTFLPLVILPGAVGLAYAYQMVFRADALQAWSIIAGRLPPGLSMSGAGLISGTPTDDCSSIFTVKVVTPTAIVTCTYLLRIYVRPISIDPANNLYSVVGTGFSNRYHFHFRGNRYALVEMTTGGFSGSHSVSVYRSLDDGYTWAAVDDSNRPPALGSFDNLMSAVWDGGEKVYVLFATSFTVPLSGNSNTINAAVRVFNLRTGTWGTVDLATTSFLSASTAVPDCQAVLLSTGIVRFFWWGPTSSPAGSQYFLLTMDFDPVANTLSSPTNIFTPSASLVTGSPRPDWGSATHQPTSFVGGGTIDVTHLFFYGQGSGSDLNVYYLRVDATPSVTTSHTFSLALFFNNNGGEMLGCALLEPMTNSLVVGYDGLSQIRTPGRDTNRTPHVFRGTPLEAPVWTDEFIAGPNPTTDNMNEVSGCEFAPNLFRAADGRQAAIWCGDHDYDEGDNFTSFFISYYDPAHPELGWTPHEEFYSYMWNPYTDPPNNLYSNEPLDEAPIWAEADFIRGGFYFMFVGDLITHSPPLINSAVYAFQSPDNRIPACVGGALPNVVY